MKLFVKFLITPVVLLAVAYFFEAVVVESIYIALIVAVLLGLLNLLVRPILIILSLPVTILTFGLFIFVINAGILWFISSFVEGFAFGGFLYALLTALLLSLAHWIGDTLVE